MPDYRVKWEIDIEADSPRQAAEIAREIQLDPESLARFYEVSEHLGSDRIGAGKMIGLGRNG